MIWLLHTGTLMAQLSSNGSAQLSSQNAHKNKVGSTPLGVPPIS